MLELKKKKERKKRDEITRRGRGALGNRTNAASDKRDVTQAQNTWKATPALAMLQRYATFSCCFWGKNVKEKIKMFVLWIEKKKQKTACTWMNQTESPSLIKCPPPPSVLVANTSSAAAKAMLMRLKVKEWNWVSWRSSGDTLPRRTVRIGNMLQS